MSVGTETPNSSPTSVSTNGSDQAPSAVPVLPPLRSVCTDNFSPILEELKISILVTTYQAGKLLILRPQGTNLNTHFRAFNSPMGMALQGERLALGTPGYIWEFRNMPMLGKKMEPVGQVGACFMPRASFVTGNVQIHEMAYGGSGELWFANTRFSCLCTMDGVHSFVPRWKPPFISQLAPEDRCHLNGLGMRDGQPGFVTALGVTDTAGGWRENKRDGGALMHVPSGEVIARGLSMPHSPRWHDGRLWVLESGRGTLSVVDPANGKSETVAVLPGFTRGIDFAGPLAFIGLSQVRETAVFSGIPITENPQKRSSGVWVVNIHTGKIIAMVEFEDALQEIFAVQVVPGVCHPELINDDFAMILDSFEIPTEAMGLVGEDYRSARSETNL